MAEPPSSPPSAASAEDALAWYKSNYELLVHELSEFQSSSRELEAELEKDLDAADKRERGLQEKAETLSYEVEEWKRKYKESKAEANSAQSVLEKEITTLRDANRTLTLKLRDIEVANDDFERQARNTTSSLEDLESKYNVAIERAVMMEEEIKIGEQERENLRVETQRLREELSDLKIEADILQDKIRKQESRHLSAISTDISILDSTFDHSPNSTASSPMVTTPPDTKSLSEVDTLSDLQEPPSPPMSDASLPLRRSTAAARTPAPTPQRKHRLPSADSSVTPKPKHLGSATSGARRIATTASAMRTPAPRPSLSKAPPARATSHRIPASTSLTHIRSLTAQMQRLEARVQSARSKLPAPVTTPPRASPRSSAGIPASVTVRSRKRTTGSSAAHSLIGGIDGTPSTSNPELRSSMSSSTTNKHIPRLSTSGVTRLSFGPLPKRNPSNMESSEMSRPSSRASVSSYARPASRTDSHNGGGGTSGFMPPPRPMSRASLSGTRTPLGRPRSSLGGNLHGHTQSQSVSYSTAEVDELMGDDGELRTPSRRGTYSRLEMEAAASGIATPSGIPMPGARRQSAGTNRRTSAGSAAVSKLADVGETY